MLKDRRIYDRKMMSDWLATQKGTRCNRKGLRDLKREMSRMERQNGKEYLRNYWPD